METNDPRIGEVIKALTEYQSALLRYIFLLLGDAEASKDVLQETNLYIWQNIGHLDSPEHFKPWAKTLAAFQIKRFLKTRAAENRRLVFDSDTIDSLADTIAQESPDPELREIPLEALGDCLGRLPPPKRRLIDRRYWKRETVKAIADADRVTPFAAATALMRIRKDLNDCVRRLLCRFDDGPRPTPREEGRSLLIERALEGDPSSLRELESLLRTDPAARREWIETGGMHLALTENAELFHLAAERRRGNWRARLRLPARIAAGLLIIAGIGWAGSAYFRAQPPAATPAAPAAVTLTTNEGETNMNTVITKSFTQTLAAAAAAAVTTLAVVPEALAQSTSFEASFWQTAEIGGTTGTFAYDEATGRHIITASAGAVNNDTNRDSFCFLYRPVAGDFTLTVLVTNATGRCDLTLRNDLTSRCAMYSFYRKTDGSAGATVRFDDAGSSGASGHAWDTTAKTAPYLFRLQRRGDLVSCAWKAYPNGTDWTVPTAWTDCRTAKAMPALHETVYAGLAISGGSVEAATLELDPPVSVLVRRQGENLVLAPYASGLATSETVERRLTGSSGDWQTVWTATPGKLAAFTATPQPYDYRVTLADAAGTALSATVTNLAYDAASLCGLYEDRDTGLFAAARNDANTDFDWHAGTGIPELAAANSFKTCWYGDFVAPVSGTYTFYTIHNNGVRFYFNTALGINNWLWDDATRTDTCAIPLTAGRRYPVALQYFTSTNAACKLLCKAPGASQAEQIPATNFVAFPYPWSRTAIGLASSSSAEHNLTAEGRQFRLYSNGTEIGQGSDGMTFVWQPVYGDCELIARLDSLKGGAAWSKLVLGVRESVSATNSRAIYLAQRPGDYRMALIWQQAKEMGSQSTPNPGTAKFQTNKWMRIVKKGLRVTASYRYSETDTWKDIPLQNSEPSYHDFDSDCSPYVSAVGIGLTSLSTSSFSTGLVSCVTLRCGPRNPCARRRDDGKVLLSWDSMPDTLSNIVSRSSTGNDADYAAVATLPAGTSEYLDASAPATAYYKITSCYPAAIACSSAAVTPAGLSLAYYGSINSLPTTRDGLPAAAASRDRLAEDHSELLVPADALWRDGYCTEADTFFTAPADGTYTFRVRAQGGLRFWANGAPVSNQTSAVLTTNTIALALKSGKQVSLRLLNIKDDPSHAFSCKLDYADPGSTEFGSVDETVAQPLPDFTADPVWSTNSAAALRVRASLNRSSWSLEGPCPTGTLANAAGVWAVSHNTETATLRICNYGSLDGTSPTNALAGLLYRGNSSESFLFAGCDASGAFVLALKRADVSAPVVTRLAAPASGPGARWIRVSKDGNSYAVSCKTDSTDWAAAGQLTASGALSKLGLVIGGESAGTVPFAADFTSCELKQPRGTCYSFR